MDTVDFAVSVLSLRLPLASTDAGDAAHGLFQIVASALRRYGSDEVFFAYLRNPADCAVAVATVSRAVTAEPGLERDLAAEVAKSSPAQPRRWR
jgi:hypothetical protein